MQYTPSEMACIFSRSQHEFHDLSLFKPDRHYEQIMNQSGAYYFSIDYTNLQYIFLSSGVRKVLGYEQKEWFEQGINFFFKILHPDDREAMRKVHLDTIKVWLGCPAHERAELSFNFDYRVFAADGRVVRLNQHTVFLKADTEGIPLVDFSVCTDISSYKSEGPVSLHIKKSCNADHDYVQHIIYDDVPGGLDDVSSGLDVASCELGLSHRELEIIKLLSEGLTSRQVSQKLYISQHTVRTHRKNILKKTNCSSTVELVNLAKERGMICSAGRPGANVNGAEQQKQVVQRTAPKASLVG